MEFGAQLSSYRLPWPQIEATIRTIESGSWSSLWFSDHFLPPADPSSEHKSALEVWTLVTAAAMLTQRVRLGTLACGITYRNPALLAKICASVDHISGGRMELGIGAAWFEREHQAYGWEFPTVRERCDRLEEAAELIRLLFTKQDDEKVSFEGNYYRLDEAPLAPGSTRPRSTRKAHIPILIGGNGEKRTLRTCARYGDISNPGLLAPRRRRCLPAQAGGPGPPLRGRRSRSGRGQEDRRPALPALRQRPGGQEVTRPALVLLGHRLLHSGPVAAVHRGRRRGDHPVRRPQPAGVVAADRPGDPDRVRLKELR